MTRYGSAATQGKRQEDCKFAGQATKKTIPKLEVWYTSRTFVNATMSSHPTQQLTKGNNNWNLTKCKTREQI
jgi:hypothetical protein